MSTSPITIEIRGADFTNKGAELMLCAVVQELERWPVPVRPVVSPPVGPYTSRAKLGLYQKVYLNASPALSALAGHLAPDALTRRYGLIFDGDIDAVLDCSGFAYSDQWGAHAARDLAGKAARWQKQGKRVVLLPQALGPFEKDDVASAFGEAVKHIDLIYARDATSRHYAEGAGGGSVPHLRQAPDFTCLVSGTKPTDDFTGRAAVVPNLRMIDKTSGAASDAYPQLIISAIRALQKRDARPFLLVHDSDADYDFAHDLAKQSDVPVDVVVEMDPLRLKGILGQTMVVVASRYHALVSALAQGVPILATSWSHKYEALMQDFGTEDFLLKPGQPNDVGGLVDRVLDAETRAPLVERIEEGSARYRRESRAMWDAVRAHVLAA